jgi:hypothetical protein
MRCRRREYNPLMSPCPLATATPDHALFARDLALTSLRLEHPVTRRVIEAIPLEKGAYRPDEVVKSAYDLAWPIVAAEHRFLEAFVTGVSEVDRS